MTDRDEITEQLRELRSRTPAAPYPVVWRLLREQAGHEQAARTRAHEAAQAVATLADDVGLALHKLRDFLRISGPGVYAAGLGDEVELLASIAGKFGAALERAGAQVVDPLGRRYSEVADVVEVLFVDGGAPTGQLVVTATVQAGLRMSDGALVRPAKVELGPAPSENAASAQNSVLPD